MRSSPTTDDERLHVRSAGAWQKAIDQRPDPMCGET